MTVSANFRKEFDNIVRDINDKLDQLTKRIDNLSLYKEDSPKETLDFHSQELLSIRQELQHLRSEKLNKKEKEIKKDTV